MRDLYIMRHAKSSWTALELDDFDRVLNKRGRANAKAMADWMIGEGYSADLTLCSDARRTRETFEILSGNGFVSSETRFENKLYLATPRTIFTMIKAVKSEVSSLMIIAHNPGLQILATELLCNIHNVMEVPYAGNLPTAAFVHLRFHIDSFGEIDVHSGTLEHYMTPKQLQSLSTD